MIAVNTFRVYSGFLILTLVATSSVMSSADNHTSFPPEFIAKVDSVAEAFLACYKIPAITIAAIDFRDASNRMALTKAYGVKNIERPDESVTTRSKFAIASISKSFTAATFANYIKHSRKKSKMRES